MLKIPLWRTQLCKVRIWSAQDFREYLWATHGISLDKYLLSKENSDIIFFSKTELANSHSDVDNSVVLYR